MPAYEDGTECSETSAYTIQNRAKVEIKNYVSGQCRNLDSSVSIVISLRTNQSLNQSSTESKGRLSFSIASRPAVGPA